ncbi:MAG: Fis family transcriptional regulator [Sphingobium sp. 66-54]|nr:MAG: Fis family transcriptional regulator [Sphingobium sp. 66-54]
MTFPRSEQTVLLVDDDPQLRQATEQSLELAGMRVSAFASAHAALAALDRDFDGVLVTDIRMARMDGLQLFEEVQQIDPEIPVIFITGHADVSIAVRALRDGAFDFLTKPFAVEELIASIRNALEKRQLVLDNRYLRETLDGGDSPLIGDSAPMVKLRETIAQIARADIDVLIEGETGTGKELVALLLHRKSPRRGRPFVAVNCSALPDDLAELDLFGRAYGVVQNDPKERIGRIVASNSGTLFLDEIDSTSPAVQAKLLRVIEEREVVPIGAHEPRAVDLRVIAASKSDLAQASDAGAFRKDLYYRLNVVRLRLPPLREHRADIPQLFSYFIDIAKEQMGIEDFAMDDEIRRHLLEHDWPGNVRELRNFAFSAVIGLPDGMAARLRTEERKPLPKRMEEFEASAIRDALELTNGDIAKTMALLVVPRKTLYDKLTKHCIDPKAYRMR